MKRQLPRALAALALALAATHRPRSAAGQPAPGVVSQRPAPPLTFVLPALAPGAPTLGDRAVLAVQPALAAQLRVAGAIDPARGAGEPGLELRRLRVGLRLFGLDNRLAGQVVVNASPAALELLDAWAELRAAPGLRVRVGQSKVPFTAYRLSSFTELGFVDWALVTRPFGNERQLGVELHNRGELGAVEYGVGLFHGQTMRSAHGAGVAADYGERLANLSDLRTYTAPEAPHPELVGRVAWHYGRRASWLFASNSSTQGAGLDLGLSASVDARPRLAREFVYAFAPEAALRAGPFSLSATGYLGLAPRAQSAGLAPLWGALVEASLAVRRRALVSLRYARVERDAALRDDARARAAALVAAAPEAQREALATQYRDAGAVASEQELSVGVAVSLYGTLLVWHTDASWLHTARVDGERHELRYRTQLQLLF